MKMKSFAPSGILVIRHLAGVATAAALLVLSMAGACSSDESDNLFQSPCDTQYKGKCGTPCSLDPDCPTGLYCANGACTADCVPGGAQCGIGQTCSANGHCSVGGGEGGGQATASGPGSG